METARVLYPGLFQAEKRGNESMQEESPTQTSANVACGKIHAYS
jgi:hypothetical protein